MEGLRTYGTRNHPAQRVFVPHNVFVLLSHDRRRIVHWNVTAHPTAPWVWRQIVQATPWGSSPRFLIRDRDRSYGADFVARAAGIGIEAVPLRYTRHRRTPSLSG